MKTVSYTKYRKKPLFEPEWLYYTVYVLLLMLGMYILSIVFGVITSYVFNTAATSPYTLSISSQKSDLIAILMITAWYMYLALNSCVKVHNTGKLEFQYAGLRRIEGRLMGKFKNIIINIDDIREIDVIYMADIYKITKLFLRISTTDNTFVIDVKEHNEFIKELLRYNPDIKVPSLPII